MNSVETVTGTKMNLGDWFVKGTRADLSTFTSLRDGHPEWLHDAVREAHAGDLPNDWVYETCRAVCEAIDEGQLSTDEDSGAEEFADSQVEIYTKHLFNWAAEFCLTSLYGDAEAEAEDMGVAGNVEARLKATQYCAIRTIAAGMVTAWIESRDEESDGVED